MLFIWEYVVDDSLFQPLVAAPLQVPHMFVWAGAQSSTAGWIVLVKFALVRRISFD